jgi:hypothetical protein
VNRVAISVYLRREVGTMNKRAILEAVEAMLDDPEGHTIGRTIPKTFTRVGTTRRRSRTTTRSCRARKKRRHRRKHDR